jgi:hypothetical protein
MTVMKIRCDCGATIHDITDNQPWKAHFIADQDWDTFWDAIDEAIEKSGPSAAEKEAACMKLRYLTVTRMAWQCSACGRIYIDDQDHQLQQFVRASDHVPCELFRSRPTP